MFDSLLTWNQFLTCNVQRTQGLTGQVDERRALRVHGQIPQSPRSSVLDGLLCQVPLHHIHWGNDICQDEVKCVQYTRWCWFGPQKHFIKMSKRETHRQYLFHQACKPMLEIHKNCVKERYGWKEKECEPFGITGTSALWHFYDMFNEKQANVISIHTLSEPLILTTVAGCLHFHTWILCSSISKQILMTNLYRNPNKGFTNFFLATV